MDEVVLLSADGAETRAARETSAAAEADLVLAEVERRLERFFDAALVRATRHSPHYRALWSELRSSTAGGKRVRPRLAVVACLHLGGGPLEPLVAGRDPR